MHYLWAGIKNGLWCFLSYTGSMFNTLLNDPLCYFHCVGIRITKSAEFIGLAIALSLPPPYLSHGCIQENRIQWSKMATKSFIWKLLTEHICQNSPRRLPYASTFLDPQSMRTTVLHKLSRCVRDFCWPTDFPVGCPQTWMSLNIYITQPFLDF